MPAARILSLAVLTYSGMCAAGTPALFVNPFIGTGNGAPDYNLQNSAGNTPPGAAFPFGMMLWSPDTTMQAGGYRYQQDVIQGFSLTHFSGRGISCYQDVPVMPISGSPVTSPGADWLTYSARFQHANEAAAAGYYSVLLNNGIKVELTVTQRTGFGRFTFPAGNAGTLLINAGGSANGNRDDGTWVELSGPGEITGAAASGDCGGWFTYRIYFALRFDRPLIDFGTWNGESLSPHTTSSQGSKSGAYLTFDTGETAAVQVRVGLSFVSVANARRNLETESPAWDFDAIQARAAAAWNARLGAIEVDGGTLDQKTVFYTALYHSLIHPSTFSDSNGEYLGFDGRVHTTDSTQYHNFPTWDDYRSLMPLLAAIAPEAGDMVQSLVNDALQDPSGGLPRWEHANTNSGGMAGDGPAAVIATVHAFGARNFDTAAALAAMDKGASQAGVTSAGQLVRPGLADYLNLGYVSTATSGSASLTLEYAIDDFSIAQFARALGDTEKYRRYLRRAQNWRNLFHDGYIVPRAADGTFSAFTPSDCCNDFTEGSPAQYVWMVPFNMRGLFDAMGGNAAAIARLDRHFTELNAGPGSEYAFMGNEPELKTPWAYAFAGAPWRSQQVVRRILLELFRNAPEGMPGNDDGGVLSSWVVFAAIGLYPEIPGVGGFVTGSPLFPEVTVHLAGGGDLRIHAPLAAAGTPFVQGLRVNGTDYNSPWIPWERLAGGAELEFLLADAPAPAWGSSRDAAAPSFDAN